MKYGIEVLMVSSLVLVSCGKGPRFGTSSAAPNRPTLGSEHLEQGAAASGAASPLNSELVQGADTPAEVNANIASASPLQDQASQQLLNLDHICSAARAEKFSYDTGMLREPFSAESDGKWVHYSSSAEIDVSQTKGQFLPVRDFNIDDVAILLKPDQSIAQSGGSQIGETVTFTLPDNALVLSDPKLPGGQAGHLTPAENIVFNTKVYLFKDRQIEVPMHTPQGKYLFINDLIPRGLPVVPYDRLDLARLREHGFVDAAGILRFKIASVTHGWGGVSMSFDFAECSK